MTEERIAKRIARAGICSRRDAEKLIIAGKVKINNKLIDTPAIKVTDKDIVSVNGEVLDSKEDTRLWVYHKPKGLVTSHKDDRGRTTVFETLPPDLPRVISVGRLDLNSEGLLLLTNDGDLSRYLEHPTTGLSRKYRVRAYGNIKQPKLDTLKNGVKLEGIQYGPIEAAIESSKGDNTWLSVILHEGKNREIRKVFEYMDLTVNRLIRVSYGDFQLGKLPMGDVKEVPYNKVKKILSEMK